VTAAGTPSPAAVLQLDDGAAAAGPDPLGLWRSLPAAPASAAEFSATAPPIGLIWRVCLPAGTAADTLLTRAELSLAETQAALATIEPLLLAFIARHAATPFAGPREPSTEGELELGQLLAELRATALTDHVAGFAPRCLPGRWEQVLDEASAFLARLDRATGDPARVETEQGGRVLAITELGWRGVKTAWLAQPGTEQRTMHERAVGLAFASRLAMMRTFATAIRASILLAVLLTPGGAPFAFPAALRFAARILAEARGKPTKTVAAP
jgi:hypothetical protein